MTTTNNTMAPAATTAPSNATVTTNIVAPTNTIAPVNIPVPVPQPQAPAPVTVNPNVHPITQAAVQDGVLTCTSRINQITKFLTNNSQSGADLIFDPNGPDQHTFSASLEIIAPNNASLYATTSFTPTPIGGCDAVYDTVQFVPESCGDAAIKHFKVNRYSGVLKRNIFTINAGSVKFYLMSAGSNGCVVIKKEVVQ